MSESKRASLHQIVVNDAREFAVWPSAKPLPASSALQTKPPRTTQSAPAATSA